MDKYKFTDYFEKEVLRKRPYLKKDRCIYVIENAVRSEPPRAQSVPLLGRYS
jgi:hypothetical protein